MQSVDSLIEEMKDLSKGYTNAFVYSSLIDAVSWLKGASEVVSASSNGGVQRFHLSDAEDILVKSQVLYCCYLIHHHFPFLRKYMLEFVCRFIQSFP